MWIKFKVISKKIGYNYKDDWTPLPDKGSWDGWFTFNKFDYRLIFYNKIYFLKKHGFAIDSNIYFICG